MADGGAPAALALFNPALGDAAAQHAAAIVARAAAPGDTAVAELARGVATARAQPTQFGARGRAEAASGRRFFV